MTLQSFLIFHVTVSALLSVAHLQRIRAVAPHGVSRRSHDSNLPHHVIFLYVPVSKNPFGDVPSKRHGTHRGASGEQLSIRYTCHSAPIRCLNAPTRKLT